MQPPLSGAPVTLAPSDTSPPPRVPVHPSPSPPGPGAGLYTPPAPLPVLSFCPPNHRDESNNSSSNGGRGHGRLSRAPRPAGAIDESSCSTLHGRTRCPLWLRRPPWGPRRWLRLRRRRTGCAVVPALVGRGRGRTSCTTRRRRRRWRRWCKGGGLAVRATGCSCWRRWRKRRRGRPRRKTSGPPLAPSPRGTRRKGRRRRAPGRRRGRGGPRRPAGSRASTPSTTPSPSSGGCRASSPASRGRSRTCRTWPWPAPPAARTCWPSRRTPSTSAAGSCGAAPSGGSPPPRSPRCRPSCRPSRPSTSATTASSTAAAAPVAAVADHQPIQGRRTCTDQTSD